MARKLTILTILIIGLIFSTIDSVAAKEDFSDTSIVGGDCSYDEFEGVCKVMNLYFNPEKDDWKLVKFKFEPYVTLDAKMAKLFVEHNLIGTDQEMPLDDFAPANWNKHDKNSLEIGDSVNCKLKIETSGTCVPITFSLEKILKDKNAYNSLSFRRKIINILVPISLIMLLVITMFPIRKKLHNYHRSRRKRKR